MRLTVRVTGSQCLHLRRTSLHLLLLHLQLLRLALNLPLVVSTLLYQQLLLLQSYIYIYNTITRPLRSV